MFQYNTQGVCAKCIYFEVEDKKPAENKVFASFVKEDIVKPVEVKESKVESKPTDVTRNQFRSEPVKSEPIISAQPKKEEMKPIRTTEKVQTFGSWRITTEEPIYSEPEILPTKTDDDDGKFEDFSFSTI